MTKFDPTIDLGKVYCKDGVYHIAVGYIDQPAIIYHEILSGKPSVAVIGSPVQCAFHRVTGITELTKIINMVCNTIEARKQNK